jgi:sarcosine oxidase / L-pipecolate oxidase
MKAYPCFKNLPFSYKGVFAPDNGSINVPLVLRVLKHLAEVNGANLVSQCKVTNFAVKPSNVEVGYEYYNETGTITARKAIIADGAYTNDILKPLNI